MEGLGLKNHSSNRLYSAMCITIDTDTTITRRVSLAKDQEEALMRNKGLQE